ncbi:protein derived from transposon [Anaeramoeba flamelloides]|uniref:Protein derived from transposon n=1 Tax=Anaeramoeba flamelloides TaxID=1746091 RepID=A0ABQ8YTN4_9EUKA|nr:protein derived from transposon [Anaeramoeba flamelloides]
MVYTLSQSDVGFRLTLKEVSSFAEFPYSSESLRRAVNSLANGRPISNKVNPGRPFLLNHREEQFVVDMIKKVGAIGWAPTIHEVVEFANSVINNWTNPLNKKVKRKLVKSRNWVRFFCKRNGLFLKTPIYLEEKRVYVTEEIIFDFVNKLQGLYLENEYLDELIFNMDETSLRINNSRRIKVLTTAEKLKAFRRKGAKGAHMSAVVTISAGGELLPTYLILPWAIEVFIPYVLKMRKKLNCKGDRALLILDGHSSRSNPDVLDLFALYNIDCVVIPAHSSHIIQPLDVGVFHSFKSEVAKIKGKKSDYFGIVEHALRFATSPLRINGAFRNAGIFPLNFELLCNKKEVFQSNLLNLISPQQNIPRGGGRFNISGKIITNYKNRSEIRRRSNHKKANKNIVQHNRSPQIALNQMSQLLTSFQTTLNTFQSQTLGPIQTQSQTGNNNSSGENLVQNLTTMDQSPIQNRLTQPTTLNQPNFLTNTTPTRNPFDLNEINNNLQQIQSSSLHLHNLTSQDQNNNTIDRSGEFIDPLSLKSQKKVKNKRKRLRNAIIKKHINKVARSNVKRKKKGQKKKGGKGVRKEKEKEKRRKNNLYISDDEELKILAEDLLDNLDSDDDDDEDYDDIPNNNQLFSSHQPPSQTLFTPPFLRSQKVQKPQFHHSNYNLVHKKKDQISFNSNSSSIDQRLKEKEIEIVKEKEKGKEKEKEND